MPKEKQGKLLCVDNLRHAEYYQMQDTFDDLYARSKAGEKFTNLMDAILSPNNILLAYRNIKGNSGSQTPGTDKQTIRNISDLTSGEVIEKVRFILTGSKNGYRPKPVRRKDIPKPNGSTRPLGIPCIWDRLVQQCIKQVMEPICEAKFSNNSFGFRPLRSVEHAIDRAYRYLQLSHLHYVIEFDIKGFFDNVNHSKLMKQIWALGIQDKHLIYIIKQILKAPIQMPNGEWVFPEKGTPQGGIISPLLANIVLNELDHWVESQWQENPVGLKHRRDRTAEGKGYDTGNGYRAMRRTGLKEMYIVRYADDFRIFCRTKNEAQRTMIAVTQWLRERLKLEVSPEKTKIVNVKRRYSEFLGFKIKVHRSGNKDVVKSHICDKALEKQKSKLTTQARNIARPRKGRNELWETQLFNSMVLGVQNYYRIATCISMDCQMLNRSVMTVLTNRLVREKSSRLAKTGRLLTKTENKLYGDSAMLRYSAGTKEPIYPIGYVQHANPMARKAEVCAYTVSGRIPIHTSLRINTQLMWKMSTLPICNKSVEYNDNRISLFSAQWGQCAVTGIPFVNLNEIHCHHKIPRHAGGTDEYSNLTLILEKVHVLIHAVNEHTIRKYMDILKLSASQLAKVNRLRSLAGLNCI